MVSLTKARPPFWPLAAALALGLSQLCDNAAAAETDQVPRPRVDVDLELVLATDTSQSIDSMEAALQRRGVAAAFRSPEIVKAIQSGSLGRIAVAYIDWSSPFLNRVVVDWRLVSDKASADAFADTLLRARPTYGQGTSIGGALAFAAALIDSNAFDGTERTIDISGDGPNNTGRPVADVRDEIVARGITINGLPILTGDYGGGDWGIYYGEIDRYYAGCVIGGRRAFALPAKGFADFASAIRRKLVLEISDVVPEHRDSHAAIVAVAAPIGTAQPSLVPPTPPPVLRLPGNGGQTGDKRNCSSGFGGRGGFGRPRGF